MTLPTNLSSIAIIDLPHQFKLSLDGRAIRGVKGYAVKRDKDKPVEVTIVLEAENVSLAAGPDED